MRHPLLTECESELYPLLVREHAEHPLYVLSFDDVADLPQLDAYGWAYSEFFMDPNLIDRIDDYRGPGPVIMLDLISIGAVAEPGCFERCVRNVFIHELGHPPFLPMLEPPDTDRARDMTLRVMKRESVSASPKPFTPADSHDASFIRRTTHLAYRAIIAGVDFTTHNLYGHQHHFSRFETYLPTLLPECVRMADATFKEIAAVDPPAAFSAQWEADQQFYDYQRTLTENNRLANNR